MAGIGTASLIAAFVGCIVSVAALCAALVSYKRKREAAFGLLSKVGCAAAALTTAVLSVCVILLLACFLTGDVTVEYVLRNRSVSSDSLNWLYTVSGLWAGRAGSLMFWAWLISVFDAFLLVSIAKSGKDGGRDALPLDLGALVVSEAVLLAFLGVVLLSPGNMPFAPTPAAYFGESGELVPQASALGMNMLLRHWAMVIHPPTLFIGYAGLTIPFAYAISALIANDDSDTWVRRATPYLMFSWLFLGLGIGLGAVWAYVVLGWGGYWGWDAVENASLLPWLIGVALIHSFTVYRKRGQFKRWSVMCACLAFAFVVLGTFITRSGLVQSVHSFNGDDVSVVLFLTLIAASLLSGAIGLFVRRKTFGAKQGDGDIESLASRDAAYYLNNLVMVVFAALLAYMTVSSALPPYLPFGGQSFSANSYNALARPLGIAYCALVAVCPLLGWRSTSKWYFWQKARIPTLCAAVLFVVLFLYFITYLLPGYAAAITAGGSASADLLEQGAPMYYNGLAVVGFLVASLLFFNSAFMIVNALGARTGRRKEMKGEGVRVGAAEGCGAAVPAPEDAIPNIGEQKTPFSKRLAGISGGICHAAMGVLLIGLIGSSMYVTEVDEYMDYDEQTDACAQPLKIRDFELNYTGSSIDTTDDSPDITYTMYFDVTRNGDYIASVSPAVEVVKATLQQKLIASVVSLPAEDLFVVYNGVNADGDISMDVRINPLIGFVWIGFGMLMCGAILSLFASRGKTASGMGGADDPSALRFKAGRRASRSKDGK